MIRFTLMLTFKGVGEVCPVSEVRLASSLDLKRNQFFRTLDSWLLSRWQFCVVDVVCVVRVGRLVAGTVTAGCVEGTGR